MKYNKRGAKIQLIKDHNEFFNKILRNEFAKKKTKEVKLSSYGFYGGKDKEIKDFCDNKKLQIFYSNQPPTICSKSLINIKQIQNLHSKIYWFLGYGAYIGSANCTEYGWKKNIECGLWFPDHELRKHDIEKELTAFFKSLEEHKETA